MQTRRGRERASNLSNAQGPARLPYWVQMPGVPHQPVARMLRTGPGFRHLSTFSERVRIVFEVVVGHNVGGELNIRYSCTAGRSHEAVRLPRPEACRPPAGLPCFFFIIILQPSDRRFATDWKAPRRSTWCRTKAGCCWLAVEQHNRENVSETAGACPHRLDEPCLPDVRAQEQLVVLAFCAPCFCKQLQGCRS